MPVLGLDEEVRRLMAEVDALEVRAVVEVQAALKAGLATALANTPVWSGESVANYHVGSSRSGSHVSPSGEQPPKQATNSLPLGAENNRGVNEDIARASLDQALATLRKTLPPIMQIYSTLSAEKADLIDNGAAPSPSKARNKGGVMKLAEQTIRASGNWS